MIAIKQKTKLLAQRSTKLTQPYYPISVSQSHTESSEIEVRTYRAEFEVRNRIFRDLAFSILSQVYRTENSSLTLLIISSQVGLSRRKIRTKIKMPFMVT